VIADTDIREFTDSEQAMYCALSVSVPGFGSVVSAIGLKATFSLLFLLGGRTITLPTVSEVVQTLSAIQPVLEHRRTRESLPSIARRYGVSLTRLRRVAEAVIPVLEKLDETREEIDRIAPRRQRRRISPLPL